jgi:hypothetical protein
MGMKRIGYLIKVCQELKMLTFGYEFAGMINF